MRVGLYRNIIKKYARLPRRPLQSTVLPSLSTRFIYPPQVTIQQQSFASLQNDASGLTKRPNSHAAKTDTIYALSTAPGRAAIAIIRISGPASLDVYKTLCPFPLRLKPRYATLRPLYSSPSKNDMLDRDALVIYFPSPQSATGEDVLEFHIHGGPATVKAVLAAIPKSESSSGSAIRYAEPGEFTRRAFYNNRLDVTQIEALGDSLAAETEQQRRLAIQGSTNSLTGQYEFWRQDLLAARGRLEALIDFSEDQYFDESPVELMSKVGEEITFLSREIGLAIENSSRGELLRNGIKVALLGAPNAGKSTLLNRIVGREAAIVSSEPGTTRDVVEVNVDIGGFFCNFGDLAGLRNVNPQGNQCDRVVGAIEAEGIRRAKERVLSADVIILVLAVPKAQMRHNTLPLQMVIEDEILDIVHRCDWSRQKLLIVCNKVDLAAKRDHLPISFDQVKARMPTEIQKGFSDPDMLSCSGGEEILGPEECQRLLNAFLLRLKRTFKEMTSVFEPSDVEHDLGSTFLQSSLGATERQRLLLVQCQGYLQSFLGLCQGPQGEGAGAAEEVDIVVAAEQLRAAADCLGKIMGRGESGDVEEVLGVVFEKFCVGK